MILVVFFIPSLDYSYTGKEYLTREINKVTIAQIGNFGICRVLITMERNMQKMLSETNYPTKLYRSTTRYLVCGRPVFGVNLLSTMYQQQGRICSNPDKKWDARSVKLLFMHRLVYLVYER
jgi:hypothetical protein